MDNLNLYNNWYENIHDNSILFYPISFNFISGKLSSISFNDITKTPSYLSILEFFGFSQYNAYLNKDMILFESNKKKLDLIIHKQTSVIQKENLPLKNKITAKSLNPNNGVLVHLKWSSINKNNIQNTRLDFLNKFSSKIKLEKESFNYEKEFEKSLDINKLKEFTVLDKSISRNFDFMLSKELEYREMVNSKIINIHILNRTLSINKLSDIKSKNERELVLSELLNTNDKINSLYVEKPKYWYKPSLRKSINRSNTIEISGSYKTIAISKNLEINSDSLESLDILNLLNLRRDSRITYKLRNDINLSGKIESNASLQILTNLQATSSSKHLEIKNLMFCAICTNISISITPKLILQTKDNLNMHLQKAYITTESNTIPCYIINSNLLSNIESKGIYSMLLSVLNKDIIDKKLIVKPEDYLEHSFSKISKPSKIIDIKILLSKDLDNSKSLSVSKHLDEFTKTARKSTNTNAHIMISGKDNILLLPISSISTDKILKIATLYNSIISDDKKKLEIVIPEYPNEFVKLDSDIELDNDLVKYKSKVKLLRRDNFSNNMIKTDSGIILISDPINSSREIYNLELDSDLSKYRKHLLKIELDSKLKLLNFRIKEISSNSIKDLTIKLIQDIKSIYPSNSDKLLDLVDSELILDVNNEHYRSIQKNTILSKFSNSYSRIQKYLITNPFNPRLYKNLKELETVKSGTTYDKFDKDSNIFYMNYILETVLKDLDLTEHNRYFIKQGKNIFVNNKHYKLDSSDKYAIINIRRTLLNNSNKELKLLNNSPLLDMFRRWYFMPADGPYDKIILPNDYPYETFPIDTYNKHPFPGKDKATDEILVDINIMTNVIDFCYEIWYSNSILYTRFTPRQTINHFINTLFNWLDKYLPNKEYKLPEYYPDDYSDVTIDPESREGYWRLYRWIRWYAESKFFNVVYELEKSLDGNPYIEDLLKDLAKYVNDHHGVYGVPGTKVFNKVKGVRHKWLKHNNKREV